MVTLHGEEVKVGDEVWHILKGWGEVEGFDNSNTDYPILCVRWPGGTEWFTEEGKSYMEDSMPVLFWQPVEFEIPKKPKQREKAWHWICKTGDEYWMTNLRYSLGDPALSKFPNTEIIEPYLPSEIEREVKE